MNEETLVNVRQVENYNLRLIAYHGITLERAFERFEELDLDTDAAVCKFGDYYTTDEITLEEFLMAIRIHALDYTLAGKTVTPFTFTFDDGYIMVTVDRDFFAIRVPMDISIVNN